MGLAKAELMHFEEFKYGPIDDDRRVCEECFEDEGIQDFVRSTAKSKGCDFCKGKAAKKNKCVEINEVIEFIAQCIRREYGAPEEMLMWDSEEGHYFMENSILSTDELIGELVECKHEKVFDLILSAFDGSAAWVHTHYLMESRGKVLASLWTRFADSVKHEKRFFFERVSKKTAKGILITGAREPSDILTAISKAAKDAKLFVDIGKGSVFYRARKFVSAELPEKFTSENMGVPNREVSKKFAHRMSPAGIPLFYGSLEMGTAKVETGYAKGDVLVVAKFEAARTLHVLDLTLTPGIPSIFKEKDWDKREAILFLNQFSDHINQDVDREGHEHVEYIPSQIFTEYVRYRVKSGSKAVDGIIFPSTKNFGGKSIAIFCDNSSILGEGGLGSNCFLAFKGIEGRF